VVDKPWRRWELELRFGGAERAGAIVARLDRAVVRRGDFTLGPLDLELAWGERIALTGPNGTGKSTLVEALLGRVPLTAGERWVGPGVRVGELDQRRDGLRADRPLLEALVGATDLSQQDARSLLAKFGLGEDAVGRSVALLSPGERTRAGLARLMAIGVNWLILDEPTNHLDLPAIEQLETALDAFDGSLLLITHDRRLLDEVRLDRAIAIDSLATAR
jgi:ATPase subunit of ABC transporter with duplicated ATPase domains